MTQRYRGFSSDMVTIGRDVPAAPLAGKTVIGASNYYPERDGDISELDDASVTSSELLQRQLPGARVVKAFNNIYYRHLLALARPHGAPDRSGLLIAADDGEARTAATEFPGAIGYDAVLSGTLAQSWRQEPGSAACGGVYGPFDNEAGTPAGAAALRARIAEARPQARVPSSDDGAGGVSTPSAAADTS